MYVLLLFSHTEHAAISLDGWREVWIYIFPTTTFYLFFDVTLIVLPVDVLAFAIFVIGNIIKALSTY
jgi:hypothetical protein